MKKTLILFFLVLSTSLIFGQKNQSFKKPISVDNTKSYVKKWRFLKPVLADKKIVSLGESLHGVKEYNESKLEIIKYLHEEMGFNVLAIESDWLMNYYGNLYRNEVADTLLLKETFTPVWHTETHLELIRYLQTHQKLQIIGFDVTTDITKSDFLNESLKRLGINERSDIEVLKKQHSKILKTYKSGLDYNRDSVMAMNLEWIIEELYPNEKVIISAANVHVSKVQYNQYGYMGKLLHQKYQSDYYSIGLFHSLGNPTHFMRDYFYENKIADLPSNSLQFQLFVFGKENIFLDLEKLKRTEEFQWIDKTILNVIQANKFQYPINLSKSFNGIIWIKTVTHPNYVIKSKYHETTTKF